MKTVNSREDFLYEILSLIGKSRDVVEIGVLNGDFSQLILDILNPYELLLVDPFKENKDKYEDGLTTAYSTEQQYNNVINRFKEKEQVFVSRDFSFNVVKQYENDTFDLVYLDASHLYKDVKKDLNDWASKLKSGGLMCGHDYAKISNFGVIQAVDEFCIENNFEIILFNKNGGDWALKSKV